VLAVFFLKSASAMVLFLRLQTAEMNRAFSAGGFALTPPWGAAPGCYERCAFGAGTHTWLPSCVSSARCRREGKTKGRKLAVHGLSRQAKFFA